MFSTLALSAKMLVKRPQVLVVPIIVILVFMGVFYLITDAVLELIFDALMLQIVPETGPIEFPWHLYLQYSGEINIIVMAGLFLTIVFFWMGAFFAVYAREGMEEQESMLTALREANSRIKRIIGLVIFYFLLGLFWLIVFWLITNLRSLEIIFLVLMAIFLAITFFVYITLLFVVPIIAIENTRIKESIQKSFEFASKRFWQVFLLAIITGIIYSLILTVGEYASNTVTDNILGLVILGVFWVIAAGFVNLVLPVYYLRKRAGQ